MTDTPAILGGDPVRTEPYPVHSTQIDEVEEKLVLEVLRGQHMSGFSARPGDRFLGGEKVRAMESAFADYFGVEHTISVNSATSGLHAAVSAAKVGPGDEVIVPPTTMSATATAVVMQNAVPVFADLEDETFGLDPAAVEAAITPRTKAILAVNLFGHPARLEDLATIAAKHDLVLIEDNAQAPGAMVGNRRAGTLGHMGVQSLNYHKAIQTGEGGVVLTNDPVLAEHMQLVRNHGEVVIGNPLWHQEVDDAYAANVIGWNYRMTEMEAAVGIGQIGKLDAMNAVRQELAGKLSERLAAFDFLTPPVVRDGCTHVYYLYALRYHADKLGLTRSAFTAAMQAEGIAVSERYVRPIYLEPMYQRKIAYGETGCPFTCPLYEGEATYAKGDCPTAERLFDEEFVITDICKYPNSEREVDEFVRAVERIAAHRDAIAALPE